MVGILPAIHDLRPNMLLITISPGRFFAVNEIKGLFAYIIATYDFKFEEGQSVPHVYYFFGGRTPATVNVMFRARQK